MPVKKLNQVAAFLAFISLDNSAYAADVKISDIRAFLYLEQSGHWSDNIIDSKDVFSNTSTGGGAAKEPASNILVELVFTGDKNSAPKFASAIVNITQSGKNGQKAKTTKAFGGFQFAEAGEVHKSVFLENATCMPLEIEVKAGKSVKTAMVEFSCEEPVAPKGPGVAVPPVPGKKK